MFVQSEELFGLLTHALHLIGLSAQKAESEALNGSAGSKGVAQDDFRRLLVLVSLSGRTSGAGVSPHVETVGAFRRVRREA
jgi:hypothetical protein